MQIRAAKTRQKSTALMGVRKETFDFSVETKIELGKMKAVDFRSISITSSNSITSYQ